MKVLVCGGRNYVDYEYVRSVLDALGGRSKIHTIIHGAARGADSLASKYAKENNIFEQAFPADWNKHGRKAGPIRNREMLSKGNPDFVVCFSGGKGTAHMRNIAEMAGVVVING